MHYSTAVFLAEVAVLRLSENVGYWTGSVNDTLIVGLNGIYLKIGLIVQWIDCT